MATGSPPATACGPGLGPTPGTNVAHGPGETPTTAASSQLALLDLFFPGFSVFSSTVEKYTRIDLNLYIPVVLFFACLTVATQYFSEYVWGRLRKYFMSNCTLRTDDEVYNYVMAWVAKQQFSLKSRRFIANTNTNSRSWFAWRWNDDEDEQDGDGLTEKKRPLSYTPTFGSHYFIYKGRLLAFHRTENRDRGNFYSSTQREEISLSCFGRNPAILKELLLEARDMYLKRDEMKTSIYRGTTKTGSAEPAWQRCMSRTSRPFSTVILNEKVKKELVDDVTDYLDPATRRWYANRGIPYRRGYLLHGPPGTGKSSLSLALAGFFKMRIYIVSLSSISASEENLSSLFAELPRRCVVLLEDIDTAGLTHTREETATVDAVAAAPADVSAVPGQITPGKPVTTSGGRLSLSGLLNILDGVASQEGRVLIMTTNHLEKLDKALIRPGRVDMIVKFGRADTDMVAAIFRAIYAPLEGDDEPQKAAKEKGRASTDRTELDDPEAAKKAEAAARKREETIARISVLAGQFAAKVPAYEFSPAEIQGLLMKNKRDPEAAVAKAEAWVIETRKEKREKELREAEEKRKQDEKAKEEAAQKKEEKKAKKQKEAKRRKEEKCKKRTSREGKKADTAHSSSDSSDSSSESSSEEEEVETSSKSEKKPTDEIRGEEPQEAPGSETTKSPANGEEKTRATSETKIGVDSGYET